MATKGWTAPEVANVYTRARELCQQVGETPQLFPALWGQWAYNNDRGEYQTARELGEQLLRLAERIRDPAFLLQAHHALGNTLFYLGELGQARQHSEQGIALYDPQQHRSHAFLYGGHDPGVCCRLFCAWALWLLGYPDQALQRSCEALTLAQELAHPFSLAHALCMAAVLRQFRREDQAIREQAYAALQLSSEQGFSLWLAGTTILQGWTQAEQGQSQEGIAQMRNGLAGWQATGAEYHRAYWLALLAEAYGKGGQGTEGLQRTG
jgi:predicted ATPase